MRLSSFSGKVTIVANKRKDDSWRKTSEIYELLKQGTGWARVNKDNIEELITYAIADSETKLEQELRDWR